MLSMASLILNQVINDNIAIVVFIRTPLRYGMPDRNLFKSGGVDKIVRMLDRYIGVVITGETGRRKDFSGGRYTLTMLFGGLSVNPSSNARYCCTPVRATRPGTRRYPFSVMMRWVLIGKDCRSRSVIRIYCPICNQAPEFGELMLQRQRMCAPGIAPFRH